MSINFLAPETIHIMALKIKDNRIYSLLLTHHYLPSGPCQPVSVWGGVYSQIYIMVDSFYIMVKIILWLIVANHDCIYWLYLYGPHPLCPYLLLYYTLHPPRKLPFSGQCERLSRRLVIYSSCQSSIFCLPIGQTVSRAGPQNVMLTTCFAEEATGPQ